MRFPPGFPFVLLINLIIVDGKQSVLNVTRELTEPITCCFVRCVRLCVMCVILLAFTVRFMVQILLVDNFKISKVVKANNLSLSLALQVYRFRQDV